MLSEQHGCCCCCGNKQPHVSCVTEGWFVLQLFAIHGLLVLHGQPWILREVGVYLPPDDFKSSTTGFNPLHEILFHQRKTHSFQQIKQMPDLRYSCVFSFSSGEAMSGVWRCLLPEWSLLLSSCMRVMDRSHVCTFLTWRGPKQPQTGS